MRSQEQAPEDEELLAAVVSQEEAEQREPEAVGETAIPKVLLRSPGETATPI